MRTIRIFVSSPSDVDYERQRVERIAERLNGEFANVARLETIRWEKRHYKAHATFQTQIPEAADCDIVIAVFWSRLGSELPPDFQRMANGEAYPSGTAYETLTAIHARMERNFPDVYVFRKQQDPLVSLSDSKGLADARRQWERLLDFFRHWFISPEGHFLAAFQPFQTTDEFETKVDALLREWLEENVLHGRLVAWPIAIKGSPFCGLAAFGSKHAPLFFGRDRDVAKATDALKDAGERGCPFLLLIGASGVGKSSLVRAGLVPRLTTPGVFPAIDMWRVAVMRPAEKAGNPVVALATRLFDEAGSIPEEDEGRPPALPELAASDHPTPREMTDLLIHADASATKPILRTLDKIGETARDTEGFDRPVRVDLLIVIDQLDELFGADISPDDRERFANLLASLAASGRIWIVATLRADLYDRFLQEPALRDLKTRGAAYDVASPGSAELAEIVRKPVEAAGIEYAVDPANGERLDERLLRDAGRPDMLPLLQFALNRLFEGRESRNGKVYLTFEAYERLGGLDGAIDTEAERALSTLGEAEIAVLPRLLRYLAKFGDNTGLGIESNPVAIRSAPLAEVTGDNLTSRLVTTLIQARILLTSGEGGTAIVRLAHQRVLTSWKRANEVVKANADFFRIRDEVEAQRRKWQASGRQPELLIPRGLPLAEAENLNRRLGEELPESSRSFIVASSIRARRTQRLIQAVAAVFGLLFIGASAIGVVAFRAEIKAKNAAANAEQSLELTRETVDRLVEEVAQNLASQQGVSPDIAILILERVRSTIDTLGRRMPGDSRIIFSRAAMLAQFASVYRDKNLLQEAYKTNEEAFLLLSQLDGTLPTTYQSAFESKYLVAMMTRSALLYQMGKREDALDAFRRMILLPMAMKRDLSWKTGMFRIGTFYCKSDDTHCVDDLFGTVLDELRTKAQSENILDTLDYRNLDSVWEMADLLKDSDRTKYQSLLKRFRDEFVAGQPLRPKSTAELGYLLGLTFFYLEDLQANPQPQSFADAKQMMGRIQEVASLDQGRSLDNLNQALIALTFGQIAKASGQVDEAVKSLDETITFISSVPLNGFQADGTYGKLVAFADGLLRQQATNTAGQNSAICKQIARLLPGISTLYDIDDARWLMVGVATGNAAQCAMIANDRQTAVHLFESVYAADNFDAKINNAPLDNLRVVEKVSSNLVSLYIDAGRKADAIQVAQRFCNVVETQRVRFPQIHDQAEETWRSAFNAASQLWVAAERTMAATLFQVAKEAATLEMATTGRSGKSRLMLSKAEHWLGMAETTQSHQEAAHIKFREAWVLARGIARTEMEDAMFLDDWLWINRGLVATAAGESAQIAAFEDVRTALLTTFEPEKGLQPGLDYLEAMDEIAVYVPDSGRSVYFRDRLTLLERLTQTGTATTQDRALQKRLTKLITNSFTFFATADTAKVHRLVDIALGLGGQDPGVLNAIAWEFATSEVLALRNGPRAMKLAIRANELREWKEVNYFDTLAAAYARVGDFAHAIEWQKKALADPKLAADPEARRRLANYHARKPWPAN